MVIIDRCAWDDIREVLAKHKVAYTTHYERRDIQRSMALPDVSVDDLHISIHLIIPDYFDETCRK